MSSALCESLLHAAPVSSDRRPDSRWAYPLWGALLVSGFVLYTTSVLLVWNTPGKSLAKDFHASFLKQVKGSEYFKSTRMTQSWEMFAPNPNTTNNFVHVYVRDRYGQDWDFEQDIWEENRYPYIWYDRRGKVNRRIDGKKEFQRQYGAWVCREWERQHGGESARSVSFVRRVTKVPEARQVIANGGWNQWTDAPVKLTEQETVMCKTVPNGTLPNDLRERYGLPPLANEEDFIPVKQQTWWDKREQERLRAERDARKAADGEREDPPGEDDSPDQ
jgi:hypothetical protein